MTNNKALILATFQRIADRMISQVAIRQLNQTVTMALETCDRYRGDKKPRLAEELEEEVLNLLHKMLAIQDPGVQPNENVN
jgi:hypothetical protein